MTDTRDDLREAIASFRQARAGVLDWNRRQMSIDSDLAKACIASAEAMLKVNRPAWLQAEIDVLRFQARKQAHAAEQDQVLAAYTDAWTRLDEARITAARALEQVSA